MNDSRTNEFKTGWPVVLSATLGVGLGLSPLPFYTSGVFIGPLSHAFGWNTAQILSGLIGTTLGAIIGAPIAGFLSDRFGVRRIAIISSILFGFSWLLLALTNGSLLLFDVTWGVVGLVGAGTLPLTWTRAINNRFIVHRGLALGIALFSTGLFGALSKLYVSFLIVHVGWRGAYVGLGLLPLCISLPVALRYFHDAAAVERETMIATQPGKTFLGAACDWRFWILAATLTSTAFALSGPLPNLEQIFKSRGHDMASAVILASFVGYSVMVGRIGGGWLLDRLWAPAVGFVLLSCPAVALMILAGNGAISFTSGVFAVSMLGVAVGSEYDLIAFLTSRYFGMRSYSTIYGVLYCFYGLGAGFAPSLFGRSFERSGSYDQILHLAAFLTLFGAVLLLALGRYPKFSASPSDDRHSIASSEQDIEAARARI